MLHRWSVNVCFADCWEVYVEFIAKDLLIQAKVQAYGVECDNFRQCHWFARFRRKTCVVSRSMQMVDLTTMLYAAVHVNKMIHIAI